MKCKRLFLFIMVAVFLALNGVSESAFIPEYENWGDVLTSTDALPVRDLELTVYYKPAVKVDSQIDLYFDYPDEFKWCEEMPDFIVIRTTESSGSINGTVSADPYTLQWNRELKESKIGVFSTDFESSNPFATTYSWDFSGVEDRALYGSLLVLSNDLEVASLNHVVVKVEETPTFKIFLGEKDEGTHKIETVRTFDPLSSLNEEVDLGLWVTDSKNTLIAGILNFWNKAVIVSDDVKVYDFPLFGPGFNDDGRSPFILVPNPRQIDPALAGVIILEGNNSVEIPFTNGDTLTLSWLRASAFEDGPNATGLIPDLSSADINDDIDPDVTYVIGNDDWSEIYDGNYTLVTMADTGNYIAKVEVSADVPADKQDGLSALPLGLRFAVYVDEFNTYSPELVSLIQKEVDTEKASEAELINALRKHISFTKEWSDGTTAEIQLDDPEFEDAVGMWVEFDDDDEPTFFFTVNLLIVNGGEPGMVDSATVNGRDYIVIYDGELDDKFADPLKLTAATMKSEDGDSTTSGGGGGCSALGFVPGVGLLFLPLFMLLKK